MTYQTTAFSRVTAPSILPVNLTELKQFSRIDIDAEDAILCAFLSAATENVEAYVRRALLTQTWQYAISEWPGSRVLRVPRPPLIQVNWIRILDDAGGYETLCATLYYLNKRSHPGEIILTNTATFIAPTRYPYGIEMEIRCGYGNAAANVPMELRQAILAWASKMYEERVPMKKPPMDVAEMLAPWRVPMI
jgi:uncharacterized phiE125 gp8 family phage protein